MKLNNSYDPTEPAPEPDTEQVFVANCNCKYRFSDGTIIRLTDGVSPPVTEAQLEELKTYDHVREVN